MRHTVPDDQKNQDNQTLCHVCQLRRKFGCNDRVDCAAGIDGADSFDRQAKRLALIPFIEETSVRGKRIRCAITGGLKNRQLLVT